MSDAILVQVADAVTAALNDADDGTFSQDFEAERSYADWELPLEDDWSSKKPQVDVVPVGFPLVTELQTRGSIGYKPSVDIVVRFRLGPDRRNAKGKFTLAEIDALVFFVQEISEFFTAEHLTDFDAAAWESTEILAAHKPTHLRQHHQFTGIVRVTFNTNNDL